jgi:hypothetical protein
MLQFYIIILGTFYVIYLHVNYICYSHLVPFSSSYIEAKGLLSCPEYIPNRRQQ